MATPAEEIRRFIDGFSWQDGLRAMVKQGIPTRDIARTAGVVPRTVERWKVALGLAPRGGSQARGGTKGPKSGAAIDALKRAAAAKVFDGRISITWTADVEYEEDQPEGSRSQPQKEYGSMRAVSDAIRRGDIEGAGEAFSNGLMSQYGAPELSVTEFTQLHIESAEEGE